MSQKCHTEADTHRHIDNVRSSSSEEFGQSPLPEQQGQGRGIGADMVDRREDGQVDVPEGRRPRGVIEQRTATSDSRDILRPGPIRKFGPSECGHALEQGIALKIRLP